MHIRIIILSLERTSLYDGSTNRITILIHIFIKQGGTSVDQVLLNCQNCLPKEVSLEEIKTAIDEGNLPFSKESFKPGTSMAAINEFSEAVNHTIYDLFVNYLVDTYRAEKTATSYADKIKDVCEQCDIDMMSLYFETDYTVDDLITMYSSSGMMAAENRRQRYAPATALKAFEDFVIYTRED